MEADVQKILEDNKQFLAQSEETLQEIEALKKEKDFVLNEWKSGNTRWFREGPGRTTTEDVIKMCIEHAWAARGNYEYQKSQRKENKQ